MTDNKLPDYANDASEFESQRKMVFRKPIEQQMKLIERKIMQAHNLIALKNLSEDVQHSIIAGTVAAKMEMKRKINHRAIELGFKVVHGAQFWK